MHGNTEAGLAVGDGFAVKLFLENMREGQMYQLSCIVGCEVICYLTGCTVGMGTKIGMVMKGCHHDRGKEDENQENRDFFANRLPSHLQPP
jgi:hypothetical protein